MCSVSDDLWEFFELTTRKARKSHICEECRRTIQAGETYHYYSGKWDGDFVDGKRCQHCDAAGQWLNKVCGGYIMQELRSELIEHFNEGYGVWLGRAAIGVKRKWTNRSGELMPPMTLPENMPDFQGY